MRGALITAVALLAASALALAASNASVTAFDISDIGPNVTMGQTVFPNLLDNPATLIFDNSAALSFSTALPNADAGYPAGYNYVSFPLQNSNVAIHNLGTSGYTWLINGQAQLAPALMAIDDSSATPYYTNTRGSADDPMAYTPYFPYNIPRPQCDPAYFYTDVYFNLARTATQFGVYIPLGSNQPYAGYDDSNFNTVGQATGSKQIYVGVLGPNDTLATATYTSVIVAGFCPFVSVTDPSGGIKGVVIMDDINGGGAPVGFMDPYATFTTGTHYIHPHAGDANNDGAVDVIDLGVLATNYDKTGLPTSATDPFGAGSWKLADFNNDGNVDVIDLGVLATNYDWVGTPATAVPEPATLSLLGLAVAALLRRKR
jgi:hypothetical protein